MSILELKPGDRYGRYKIREVIGEGAFARVFKVFAPQLKEVAALKVWRATLDTDERLARAMREVAVLHALSSSHVVKIHDSGQGEDGRVFILMEHLEGQQLDRFHDFDEPMAPGRAVWLIHQACLGLAEAHVHGIVHRDVKPENIWVLPDHNVKVIDFGLARAWDQSASIAQNVTASRMLVGTPHYMQPEQLETAKLTPSSDVYSLATILYELLTGCCVFFGNEKVSSVVSRMRDNPVPWIEAHARKAVVPLNHYPVANELPPALVELIDQCLQKNPIRRPKDAGALSIVLGSILHYDFGAVKAATVRIVLPYGGYEEHLLLPGSHRIGAGPQCELRLPAGEVERVHAVLEWDGPPHYPALRPLVTDGTVKIEDEPIEERRDLKPTDGFWIGPYRIEIDYPATD